MDIGQQVQIQAAEIPGVSPERRPIEGRIASKHQHGDGRTEWYVRYVDERGRRRGHFFPEADLIAEPLE